MDEKELKERTKTFALRVLKVVEALPKTIVGKATADQLIRAGTSVAANYRAACICRSKAEFTAKLGVVLEETDESCFWLEFITEGGLLHAGTVERLLAEGEELRAIFIASVRSAKASPSANPQSKIPNLKSENLIAPSAPACPQCGEPMRWRSGKKGEFWGCAAYPACKGTMEVTR